MNKQRERILDKGLEDKEAEMKSSSQRGIALLETWGEGREWTTQLPTDEPREADAGRGGQEPQALQSSDKRPV